MASTMSSQRRAPQQERGERRLVQLLEAGAALLAEVGYEATTMTAIADRAQASIGTLYQYFPNKPALVQALRDRYVGEMEAGWALLDDPATAALPVEAFAHRLVEVAHRFMEEHPAYFPIIDAPVKFQRDQAARKRLRERIARIFLGKQPTLAPAVALRMANVSVQILKSMYLLYPGNSPAERVELFREYQSVMAAYLQSRLG